MRVENRHLRDLTHEDTAPGRWDCAVVIDVIRAFTVAPWVLRRGARRLLLAPDVDTAVAVRERHHPDALLLKDGAPDDRFALSNSPAQVARADLSGRTVIQTTGNGTRGAHAVRAVPVVLCASFATATATARAMSAHRDVLLVPTEGDEDVALADYLCALLSGASPDPRAFLRRVRDSTAGRECRERGVDPAYPGVDPEDLDRCAELDTVDVALRARSGGELLVVEAW